MNTTKILCLLSALLLLLAGCREDEPEPAEIESTPAYEEDIPVPAENYVFNPDGFPRMDGSPAAMPLAEAVTAVMLGSSRDDAHNLASFSATAQAYRNLAAGLSDIIFVGTPHPEFLEDISNQDFRYDMAPIATDALVFIVSKSNPIDNLTTEQIKAIYSGQITNWQQIGGDNVDIEAFQRNEQASSQVIMEAFVMDWDTMADAPMQMVLSSYYMYGTDIIPTAIKGFDGSAGAIGYSMYHYASNMEMAGAYKILSIDGVTPSAGNILNGAYPYLSSYSAVISKDLPEDDSTRILFNWLLSDEGQAFIAGQGYVPASVSTPAQLRWNIITDNSKLEAYENPRVLFTRLRDASLPALEPFDGYGPLLPYSASVTMNDGSVHEAKYGFVTQRNGNVVTDPIYDGIDRASYSSQTQSVYMPAYRLHMNLPEDNPDFGYRTIQAACALDGSWITPFIYENIIFRDSIIFLMRTEDSFDIDVYDYSGNLLYNLLDLEWAEQISDEVWPWHLIRSEGDGYAFIQLKDGIWAVLDVKTGEITETDFENAFTFSEGLASVVPEGSGGRWGFVDRNLEIIIPAEYVSESVFTDGRAIVESSDGTQLVIDKQGDVIYTVEDEHRITPVYDGFAYMLFSASEVTFPVFLDNDFNVIEYPQAVLPLDSEASVGYLQDGWFYCLAQSGSWLFSSGQSHLLPPSVQNVTGFIENLIIYDEFYTIEDNTVSARTGIMTLDGSVIVPPADGQRINVVTGEDIGLRVLINTDYFNVTSFTQAEYMLADPRGLTIRSGPGVISYDEAAGCFYVLGTDYFAWIDKNADTFISIPSMGYTFD